MILSQKCAEKKKHFTCDTKFDKSGTRLLSIIVGNVVFSAEIRRSGDDFSVLCQARVNIMEIEAMIFLF